jgi:hypothetical protein
LLTTASLKGLVTGVNVKTKESEKIKTNYKGHIQLANEGFNDGFRNC